MDKYIFDESSYIKFIDNDIVLIKTLEGRFKVNGFGMSEAIQNIINIFSTPLLLDDAILELKNKYSKNTLIKLIDLLISKKVLVKESEVEDFEKYDRNFIEKNKYYTINGKKLKNIIDDLSNITIGILGDFKFSECIIHNFERGGLLTNINVIVMDREVVESDSIKNSNKMKVFSKSGDEDVETLIQNSDFLLVSSNFKDNYLFNLVNKICLEKNKKWLRVLVDGEYAEIGPLFIPGQTCCYNCMDMREISNMSEETFTFDNMLRNIDLHTEQLKKTVGLYSSYSLNIFIADIVYYELINYLVGMSNDLIDNVLRIVVKERTIEKERIFKYSSCSVCH